MQTITRYSVPMDRAFVSAVAGQKSKVRVWDEKKQKYVFKPLNSIQPGTFGTFED